MIDSVTRRAGRRVVSPTLVGRATELDALLAAVTDPPAVVTVQGEAGIGKTRLVTELVQRPELAGRRCGIGGCRDLREPFPLGPVVEAVRALVATPPDGLLPAVTGVLHPLLPELSRWLPPEPPPLDDGPGERHRVFRALVELLAALGPAVMVLEDLHWADPQTVDFLDYLLGALPPRLSVVLTFRGEEAPATLRTMTARPPTSVRVAAVDLDLFDVERTRRLAAAILGTDRVPLPFAAELHRRSSGLPFAVEELLALLVGGGDRPPDLTTRALSRLQVPPGVRALTMERVERLSPPARAVVEAAAVLHVPVATEVLATVSGLSPPDLVDALDEALDRGLLAEHGERVGFRHLLAAQAVYQAATGVRRRYLHDRAATALSAVDPPPLGQIAHHLRHAGRHEEWLEAAERAADQAAALGDDPEAVRLLQEALRHGDLDPARRGRLAVKLARAAIQTVHVTEDLLDLLERVLHDRLPPAVRGELSFRLALLREAAGADARVVRRLYTDAVELLDRPDLRAWVLTGLAVPTAPGVPLAEHRAWLRRALDLLPAVTDPGFRIFLLGKITMVLVVTGDPEWRRYAAQVRRESTGTPRHRREINAYQSVGLAAAYSGHYRPAGQLLAVAARGAEGHPSREVALRVAAGQAVLDYCRGRWQGLDERVAAMVDELADYAVVRIDVDLVAALLALARGDPAGAGARLAEVAARAASVGGYEVWALAVDGLARLALARGRPAGATGAVHRFLAAVAAKGWWSPVARCLPSATALLVADGAASEAAALVDRSARQLSRLDAPLAPPALRQARATLAAAEGSARVGHRFLRAAEEYAVAGCPYEAALAAERAANVHFAGGELEFGRFALRSALDGFRRLGASWDFDRAARTARRHGVAVPGRTRGGSRGYGDLLSPREREVAELAAAGKSNRQIAEELFLSPKTVDKHVGAALRKLGLRSRSGLARRLDRVDAARFEDGVVTP
ncbi:MAG: LuxR C-terminal-related transcriptional regulator [Micromonosporaceae bacterium]|jgi:ATP/maltotriose-dependent transcriptional regulator MalT